MTATFVHGVSVSAKRGARRSPTQISAHFARALPRRDAMVALADPQIRAKAIAGCRVVLWDGSDTRVAPASVLADLDVDSTLPVRRLGSHMDARSNLMIHTTRFADTPAVVWAESKLEQLWLTELDRQADVHRYQTQACVLSWPVGDRCILQVPDILVQRSAGTEVISVRAEDNMGEYATAILADLLPETLNTHGVRYRLFGAISRQRAVNLRALGAMRWKAPVDREEWWDRVGTARAARSLGAVANCFGNGPQGRSRALRALAQCHLDLDLDRYITQSSEVTWR